MDGDETKEPKNRRAIQAGKAVLARYKASREFPEMNNTDSSDVDDVLIHANESLEHQSVSMTEDMSYRDTTQSSMSASEGEGDTDNEKITRRIAVLQKRAADQEAVIQSLDTEIEHTNDKPCSPNSLRSQSCNSETTDKDMSQVYQSKIRVYENAIAERDDFIKNLSSTLKQAVEARDSVQAQLQELIASIVPVNNQTEQKIIDINRLLQSLAEQKKKNSELEKNMLDTKEQVDKVGRDMKIIIEKFRDEIQLQSEKYKEELDKISHEHAKELNALQLQAVNDKKTIETLKLEIEAKSDTEVIKLKKALIKSQEDKELLHQQINLHKEQINELAAKCVATTSVFESKESIERSMEEESSLRGEYEKLKSKYDELSARYSATRALLDNNSQQQLADKSLGKVSTINASLMSEFNSTTYQNIDELAVQLSRTKLEEKEALERKLREKIDILEESIFSRNQQVDELNKNLEESCKEKKLCEKQLKDMKNKCDKLMAEIENLSKEMNNSKKIENELSEKLKLSSKEIKELKKLLEEKDVKISENEINLKSALEKISQYESKCDQLQNGLQQAYKQCADQERKLDQSLSMNQSQFTINDTNTMGSTFFHNDHSFNMTTATDPSFRVSKFFGNDSTFLPDDAERQSKLERIEAENQKLLDKDTGCLKTSENLEFLKKSIDSVNNEKALLQQEIAELNKNHKDECLKLQAKYDELESLLAGSGIDQYKDNLNKQHAQEMDELRKFFEEKCCQMEKQYSEEIFNQQSKKMSDDSSEIDDLTDDLYFGGGGGDAKNMEKTNKTSLTIRETIDKVLLEDESDSEENWPTELLQLRNKFTSKANREMGNLKEIHALEIMKIREDHSRAMSRLMERYDEEIRKLNETNEKTSDTDSVLMKEKNLYKTCVTLKSLVIDLVKYFVTCEEELNNTFLVEMIRRQVSLEQCKEKPDSEESLEKHKNTEDDYPPVSPKTKIKRVHFAPKISKISTIINSEIDILLQLVEEEHDISIKLREELDKCLERMKIESAELINMSLPPGETMLDTIANQLRWTTKVNEELSLKLQESENTIQDYQNEAQQLKLTIRNLQHELIIDGNKEIISEGYGEKDDTGTTDIVEEDFTELHEKARLAVINGGDDSSYLVQLIEELCRCNEKIAEDFKKDKEDLQQQVVAADNKLRSTLEFLDRQACEREAERDDAVQKIKYLEKQLKERERDKERDLRISSEPTSPSRDSSAATCLSPGTYDSGLVESLESQVRDANQSLAVSESKREEAQNDLEEAVKKIFDLRDIIRKLEDQVSMKEREEELLKNKVEDFKEIIESMTQQQQILVEELEATRTNGDSHHLSHLEDELRRHKLSTEHFNVNSTALKQMKSELREMSNHLDKRIAELEALHMCGSNLSISQPSEDVSIRDQIDASRCETPEDDPASPPTLPLDKILKLKEKLLKHSRTEEVAFKKIKDLDTQLKNLKIQNEDLIAQQETLQESNSDQLFTIEQLRGRLEEYKHSAPYAQRQATSKLEHELHDLNGKIQVMEQQIVSRDIEIKNLKQQLVREKKLIYEKQQEYESAVQNENLTNQKLRNKLGELEDEKNELERKLLAKQDSSELINSMLTDKNDEIDHLKEQLKKKDKRIEALLDESNGKQNEQKNSARTLSDIVSINSECEDICEAIRAESTNIHHNFTQSLSIRANNMFQSNPGKDTLDSSVFGKSELRIPLLDLGQSRSPINSPSNMKQMSLEGSEVHVPSPPSSSESTSHREKSKAKNSSQTLEKYSLHSPTIEELENKLKDIHEELKIKTQTLEKREMEINELKNHLDKLRAESKHSIDVLTNEKIFYKTQYESSQETEHKIRKDLEEVENILKIKTEEFDNYKVKIKINEKYLNDLKIDNKNLQDDIDKLREKNLQELSKLGDLIFSKDIMLETIKTRNIEIENENKQLYDFKTKYEKCKKELVDCQRELKRLSEESSNQNSQSDDNNNKDQEIHHLKEYLKEKEKIIREMSDDSKSLQRSLETIQNKMKESGNVIELRKKLNQERKYNSELAKMIAKLTRELEALRDESSRQITEVNDIEDRVQRELNLSADLDKSILEAIESENAEMSMNRMEIQNCTTLNIKPLKQDLEKIWEQYQDIRTKLDQQTKLNQQLKREKDDLEIHQQYLKYQVKEYEDRVTQIAKSYENEVKKNSDLSASLLSQKTTRRNLEIQFRKEKSSLLKLQSEDADLIEMLRIKCSASLKSEEKLKETLTDIREKYETAMSQLKNLKQKQIESNKQEQQQGNSSTNLPEAEQSSIKYAEKYEKEYRENIELQETMKKIILEKDRCVKKLEIAIEENEKLLSTVALLEDTKSHVEIDLKHTNDELKLKIEECEWLQKRIKTMTDAENKRSEQKTDYEIELQKLRREMSNMKEVMSDADEDANEMRRQLTLSLSEQAQLSQVVMNLRKIEADLKKKLTESTLEEGKLRVIIADLQSQLRSASVQKDYLLTKDSEKDGENDKDSHYEKIINHLNNEIERYSHEKLILHEKLRKAREDNARLEIKNRDLSEPIRTRYDSSDAVKKLQHMYGKFMRADSKRKALAFQKKYLLCVIGGYQLSEETTLAVLAQLTNEQKSFMITDNDRKVPKIRFRCLVFAVISIHRMKWKVQRWRKGIRRSSCEVIREQQQHANERTVFMPISRTHQEHSPPVKEKRISNSGGLDYQHYIQRMLTIKDSMSFASGESASRE